MAWIVSRRISSASTMPSSAVLMAPPIVSIILPPPARCRDQPSAASTTTAALKCRKCVLMKFLTVLTGPALGASPLRYRDEGFDRRGREQEISLGIGRHSSESIGGGSRGVKVDPLAGPALESKGFQAHRRLRPRNAPH